MGFEILVIERLRQMHKVGVSARREIVYGALADAFKQKRGNSVAREGKLEAWIDLRFLYLNKLMSFAGLCGALQRGLRPSDKQRKQNPNILRFYRTRLARLIPNCGSQPHDVRKLLTRAFPYVAAEAAAWSPSHHMSGITAIGASRCRLETTGSKVQISLAHGSDAPSLAGMLGNLLLAASYSHCCWSSLRLLRRASASLELPS